MPGIRQLGPAVIPQPGVQVDSQPRQQTNLSETGFLSGSGVEVDKTTNSAGDVTLSGRIRPPVFPERVVSNRADELNSLLAGDIGPVALFNRQSEDGRLSGYYEINDGSVEPIHPAVPLIQDWSASLRRAGGRGSHFRAVKTTRVDISNPFSSSTAEQVFLPQDARKVRQFNPETGALSDAPQLSSRDTDRGALVEFGAKSPNTDSLALVYDLPYEANRAGCRVYLQDGDTQDKIDTSGSSPVRQWRAVFDSDRDRFDGLNLVLTNGGLRIFVAGAPRFRFRVEEFNPLTGNFSNVISTGAFSYLPEDVDLVTIGLHRIVADVRMSDGSDTHTIRVRLPLGHDEATITSAPGASGSFPSSLQNTLSPIASGASEVLQQERDIVAKREVR
jgi:hypothetical protein